MHRDLSTSVSTIVALMAAHRAASAREGAPTAFCQDEVDRIDAYLRDDGPAASVDATRNRTPKHRRRASALR
jgi:hypothetical protein